MATLRTVTVKPDGTGDYTTIANALAGESKDLVSLGRQLDIVVGPGTYPDAISDSGFVTSATCYLRIVAAAGAEAGPAWRSSGAATISPTSGSTLVTLSVGYTRLERLQIASQAYGGGTGPSIPINITGATCVVDGCYINASAWPLGSIRNYGTSSVVRNCIMFLCDGGVDQNSYLGSGQNRYCFNVTTYSPGSGTAFSGRGGLSGNTIFRNCVAYGFTTPFSGLQAANAGNNATETAGAAFAGTGNVTLTADPFTNAPAGDFGLVAGAQLIDAGADLSAQGVTTDIAGTARPQGAAYDIGASEYSAAGPAPATISIPRLSGAGQLFAPAIARAAHPVTLPALAGGATLFAPAVSSAPHPVTLPSLTAAGELLAPTVVAGTAGDTIQLPRIAGAAAIFSPTVTQASHPVLVPQMGGGAELIAPELVHAPHPITLPQLAGAAALFSPSLSQAAHVAQLPLLAGGAQLYPPALGHGAQSVALPYLAAAAVLYAPTVRALGKPVTVRFDFGGAPTRTFDFRSIR